MKTLCLAILIVLIPNLCASGLLDLNWDVPDPNEPTKMGRYLVRDNLNSEWRLR